MFVLPLLYCDAIETEFGGDRFRMLPHLGNCSHDWIDSADADWRDESRNPPGRRIYFAPRVAGCELRVLHELRYGIDSGIRDLGELPRGKWDGYGLL